MQAGKLDRRITLLRSIDTVTPFGDTEQTWVESNAVWASYTPLSDGERLRNGQTLASTTARFVIRWCLASAELLPSERLIFDGSTYQILGIKDISRREYRELTAETVVR